MNCTHRAIRSWSQLDGSPVQMWSCVDCGLRFDPRIDTKKASNSTEPVAWLLEAFNIDEHKTLKRVVFDKPIVSPGVKVTPYYTHQPERQPLTDEQVIQMALDAGFERNSLGWTFTYGRLDYQLTKFARAIEKAHGIRGEK